MKEIWKRIPNQFDNVFLGEYVIMPNHIHGIVEICRNMINHVPTGFENNFIHHDRRRGIDGIPNNPMKIIKISLGRILRWFKGRSTFEIRKRCPEIYIIWQERYFDRVIRDADELENIREYIRSNPSQWVSDRNYFHSCFKDCRI
ncbi:transposase [Candidatus Dojkabacteria bacterium]|nr:transposase [Candidatus Dojkabacteria bacterium]